MKTDSNITETLNAKSTAAAATATTAAAATAAAATTTAAATAAADSAVSSFDYFLQNNGYDLLFSPQLLDNFRSKGQFHESKLSVNSSQVEQNLR